jgi:protein gp37
MSMLRRFPALSYDGTTAVRYHAARATQPQETPKPGLIFVAPLSDICHPDVPVEAYRALAAAVYEAPRHTYALLTKRPARITNLLECYPPLYQNRVWWGVTAENQEYAESRFDELVDRAPSASVHFLSCEPLLGPIDLDRVPGTEALSWVIVGCESGPGRRPCAIKWVRDIVAWCCWNGVKVWVKQLEIGGKVTSDFAQFPEDLRIQERPELC